MPLSPDLEPVFEDAGKQFNVDPALIKATALGESGGNARAVSPAGAGGLMQLMPETAKGLGVADPFDPVQSIYGGAAYLAQGLDKYGDPAKALMYYHGGPDESKWGQKTAAYPAYIASFYQPSRSPSAGGGNAAKPAAIADGDSGQPYAPPPQFAQERKSAMDGIEQLAAAGQPQPQPIAAAAPPQPGMSDDDLINGFVNGTLPFMQKPQAAPQVGGPAMAPDVAQLSQAGRPQLQPGGATQQQISPAYIEDAQNRAALSAALGRAVPEDVNKAASLPFVGPTEAAQKLAGAPYDLKETRQGLVYDALGNPRLNSPIRIDTVDAQGNKHVGFVTPPLPSPAAVGSAGATAQMSPGVAQLAQVGQPAQTPQTQPSAPTAPAPNGSAAGPPQPDSPMTELGPGVHQTLEGRAKSLNEEYEKIREGFESAQRAQLPMTAIQNAQDAFRTGPSAATKLGLLKAYQDFAQATGLPASDPLAKEIASGEIIGKEGTTLGFELARTLGSRESQMIVQQAIATNPGLANSPEGNRQLMALINQGLQRDIDKRQFYDSYYSGHGNSYEGAAEAFNNSHPVAAYVSRVLPYNPKTAADYAGVPGGSTYLNPHTGTMKIKPLNAPADQPGQ